VAQAPWSDQAMLRRVREQVLPSITRDEPIQAWIIANAIWVYPSEASA
jgi:SRSO17 transposase